MTTPIQAAWIAMVACLCGMGLGVVYSFLRPLRPKWTALADLLFLAALLYGWLWLSFAVCRGDLRFGYTACLFLGIFFWEMTLGKVLRKVFFGIWAVIWQIWGWIWWPVGKIFRKIAQFIKFLFASWKKWVTIGWNNRRNARRRTGGPNGTIQKPPGKRQVGVPQKLDSYENRSDHSRRIVYSGCAGAADRHSHNP